MNKKITVNVVPMGKPRMTQRDKWKQRPAVMRYRAFCDQMRLQTSGQIPPDLDNLSWTAYLPIPKSWPKHKRESMAGQLHRQKPDRDNIDKGVLDSLFKEDSGIAAGHIEKRWDDGNGARIELYFNSEQKRVD